MSEKLPYPDNQNSADSKYNVELEELIVNNVNNPNPISYEQFSKACITKSQYLEYLKMCEIVRSALIYQTVYKKCLGPDNKQKEIAISFTEKAIEKCIDNVILYLENLIGHTYEKTFKYYNYIVKFWKIHRIYTRYELIKLYPHNVKDESYFSNIGNFTSILSDITSGIGHYSFKEMSDVRKVIEGTMGKFIMGEGIKITGLENKFNKMYSNIKFNSGKITFYKCICNEIYKLENDLCSGSNTTEPENPDDSEYLIWIKQQEEFYENQEDIQYAIDELEEMKEFLEKNDELNKNEIINTVDLIDNKEHIIWILNGVTGCYKNRHNIRPVKAKVKDLFDNEVIILIDYCEDCMKYMIDEQSLLRYQNQYGTLLFFRKPFESEPYYGDNKRRLESEIRGYGYSVSQGVSKDERQKILTAILDNNWIPFVDIENHILALIAYNGRNPRNKDAKKKWEEDLEFIRKYKIGSGYIYGVLKYKE